MALNFNISLTGMSAAQKAISVATMNVSNMNTMGYVRERVNLTESKEATGAGVAQKIGSGVKLSDVQRMTDLQLSNNYNNQNSNYGYYTGVQSVLTEVETFMGDNTSGGLSKLMDKFFESWTELSKFPEESSYSYALVGETQKLTQKINEVGNELGRIKQSTIEDMNTQVTHINTIINGLTEINRRINESGNNVSNALLNERDRKIEELSSYMNIETSYESDNRNVVTVRSSGAYLVDKNKAYDISLKQTSSNEIYFTNGNTKIDMTTGKLKANLDVVSEYLDGYSNKINKFTEQLMDQINTIHRSGFSGDGTTGIDFFVGTSAKDFQMNPLLKQDASKIATSSIADAAGNTDIAKKISQVIDSEVDLNMDFKNYVSTFTLGMAQDLNTVNSNTSIHGEVLSGIGEKKANLEGVNLEEEMTNLMMYQKHFNANSKSISIISELLDTMFQMIK